MESLTVTRTIEASPADVRAVFGDLEPLMRAADFDEVTVDGEQMEISKAMGLVKISLTLRVFDDPDTVLGYQQVDGIFETMRTTYTVSERNGGTELTARTEFALDAPAGGILDATVIKRQRQKELDAQLEYVEAAVT